MWITTRRTSPKINMKMIGGRAAISRICKNIIKMLVLCMILSTDILRFLNFDVNNFFQVTQIRFFFKKNSIPIKAQMLFV